MTEDPPLITQITNQRSEEPPLAIDDQRITLRPVDEALMESRRYDGLAWTATGASYFADLLAVAQRESRISRSLQRALEGVPGRVTDGDEPIPPHPYGSTVDEAIGRLSDAARVSQRAEQRALKGLETRAMTTAGGSGGGLVYNVAAGTPVAVATAFAQAARAQSVLPPILTEAELPPIGTSVAVPRFSTGVSVAVQTAEAAAINDSSGVTLFQSSTVGTVSGKVDVSAQLFGRSDPSVDAALAAELGADFGRALDAQIVNGSGASGQITGLLRTSGITSTAYTDASPTVTEAATAVFTNLSAVATAWGRMPSHVLLAARRFFWFLDYKDTATATVRRPDFGVPLFPVPAMPTNLGAGTNEDAIITVDATDVVLAMTPVRFSVMPDVLSATLQVRVLASAYIALIPKNPEAVGKVSGTGLVTPVFM